MNKIYNPNTNLFIELNSKDGKQILKNYIKQFNGGFIRELHESIASGDLYRPFTKISEFKTESDCSLIAFSLLGLPIGDIVRLYKKNPDSGLSDEEIIGIINKFETRKKLELSQIDTYKLEINKFNNIKELKENYNFAIYKSIYYLFQYLQPKQITLAAFEVGCENERFGHSIVIARGTRSYDIICLQCADTGRYIFSYNGIIPEKYEGIPFENINELKQNPYHYDDYKELKKSELFKYMKFSYEKCYDILKEKVKKGEFFFEPLQIGKIITYLSEKNKLGEDIQEAKEQVTTKGVHTRTGSRVLLASGNKIDISEDLETDTSKDTDDDESVVDSLDKFEEEFEEKIVEQQKPGIFTSLFTNLLNTIIPIPKK